MNAFTAVATAVALSAGLTAAQPALAEIVRLESTRDVAATADALVAAAEGAGATVFARVDHGAGAEQVGADVGASQLVIFGNPALGTPAIAVDRRAGLLLPLKVLVYEDESGQVWLAWEPPSETLALVGIDPGAEFVGRMEGALRNLTAAAAGN
jgi:uncharacterized protein (DUF302 family)